MKYALFLFALLLGAAWVAPPAGGPPSPGTAAVGVAPDRIMTDPEGGAVADGVYVNRYFGLAYPLPSGWTTGFDPAPPSNLGYYVLATPKPGDGAKATLLIAAQDMFFAAKPMADAMAMAADLRRSAGQTVGLTAESGPRQVVIAGHSFARLDIGGSVLSRVVFATVIRCHIVSFTFASPDPHLLEMLAASLERLSLSAAGDAPACVENYATGDTILHKVAPLPVGPKFLKIPVRIIIAHDGEVKHIHVIPPLPAQAKSITAALSQWEFKPYEVEGQPIEVETGLVFEFKPNDRAR